MNEETKMLLEITKLVLEDEGIRQRKQIAELEAEEFGVGRTKPFTITVTNTPSVTDFLNKPPNRLVSTLNLNNDGPGDVRVRVNIDNDPDYHVLKSGESEEISYGGKPVIQDLWLQLDTGTTASVRVRTSW